MPISSKIFDYPTSQSLCDLKLWPPEQGSLKQVIPISLDLDFDSEEVDFSSGRYELKAQRATLKLTLSGADLVRGSRLGEHLNQPDMMAEVTQSVSLSLESATEAQGRLDVEVKKGVFGKLFGSISWKRRQSKRAEHDHIMKIESRIYRVIPRTSGRWLIVEPVDPRILSGRYIGSAGQTEIGPLCMITARNTTPSIQIVIAVNRDEIAVRRIDPSAISVASANKTAVVAALVRRSIEAAQVTNITLPPAIRSDEIVLCASTMELQIED